MKEQAFAASVLLRRLGEDVIRVTWRERRSEVMGVFLVLMAAVVFTSLSPIAMAQVIRRIGEGYDNSQEIFIYISAFIVLKFLGQAISDRRWLRVNPLLYRMTYIFGTHVVNKISQVYRNDSGMTESASAIAHRAAIVSKMQVGLMGVLHGLMGVIIPAVIEISMIMLVVYFFVGPGFIFYFILGVAILYMATCVWRDREIAYGASAYQADNDVLSFSGDMLANSKLAREMMAADYFKDKLSRLIEVSMVEHHKMFSIKYKRASLLTLAVTLSYVLVFLWAAWLIHEQAIEVAQLFLLVVYLDRVLAPITGASSAINNIQHGLISIGAGYRLLDDLLAEAERVPSSSLTVAWHAARIVQGPAMSLRAGVLNIGQGSVIRFSGPSGAGKTTHLRCIYRALIDQPDLEAGDVHYLGARPELIAGTVYENIALGNPCFDRQAVAQAMTPWSKSFGNASINLDAAVEFLSAGEKQWVALTRSLIRTPRLIILDESTNSMDVHTEPLVWAEIMTRLQGSTLLIVSHRNDLPVRVDHLECFGHDRAPGYVMTEDV